LEIKIYTKIILLWQVPNVLPKGSCLGALVFKPRIKCFCETFVLQKHWGFMHHCASHPSEMRAKPCVTWLFVGKILELTEPLSLCIFIFKCLKDLRNGRK
jgi:hypothetical protein